MPDDVTYDALAVPSRRRLLAALKTAGAGLDVAALSAATGLHGNTVRFHLDVLARANLVRQHSEPGSGRGRPRLLYTATEAGESRDGHALLAEMIVSHLDPATAEEAGRAWARRAAPGERTPATVTQRVMTTFADMGFDPTLEPGTEGRTRIGLHACPFRDIARRHPEVVCTMHRGLLRGLIEQHGAGEVEGDMTPFVEPDLCVAHLNPVSQRTAGAG
ncbi:helix-turn-helix domain-containing protein [Couchioplanes caeruleus]|uniref:helix-turn-helix transcriptional regulator n=1 Tax=Couchioplanes caeruleus TaxID=56438 RepID=UPI0020C02A0F|nr:helix-turn-helix domain-containing protein [Couchioplanes caeruleus]UQU61525.1 helix-turn-helix domain-containing protein [Couchioplanes caeruleus]